VANAVRSGAETVASSAGIRSILLGIINSSIAAVCQYPNKIFCPMVGTVAHPTPAGGRLTLVAGSALAARTRVHQTDRTSVGAGVG
jgi:hypothetical protein